MKRLAALLALSLLAAPAGAQSPEAFYRGKTLRLVVGVGVGGGYDTYARMLAPHIGKQLGATIVVENQPGAGGIIALNNVYNAPPEGAQLAIVNGTAATMAQLLSTSGVRFDMTKLGMLGLVSAAPWMWAAGLDLKEKSVADFRKSGRVVTWAATGIADGISDGAATVCEALAMRCKIVLGYQGSNESALAVSRGEVDSTYTSDQSANIYVKTGRVHPVTVLSRKRSRFFPDMPAIFEAADLSREQEAWVDFRANLDGIGRLLMTGPGVPPERLAVLQEAVRRALTDPDVIAEGERTQRYVEYVDPATARGMVRGVLEGLDPALKARAVDVLTKKYF